MKNLLTAIVIALAFAFATPIFNASAADNSGTGQEIAPENAMDNAMAPATPAPAHTMSKTSAASGTHHATTTHTHHAASTTSSKTSTTSTTTTHHHHHKSAAAAAAAKKPAATTSTGTGQ